MKRYRQAVFVAGVSIALSARSIALPPAPKKKLEPIRQDRVVSVGSTSISISHSSIDWKGAAASGKQAARKEIVRSYQINQWTEVQVDGKRASPGDIKAGMAVTVSSSAPINSE